jgi:hypothetical protein
LEVDSHYNQFMRQRYGAAKQIGVTILPYMLAQQSE